MHALGPHALSLVKTVDGQVVLDDAAIDELAEHWGKAVEQGEAFAGAEALTAVASVLLAEEKARVAARTLLALVAAVLPALAKLDAARAQALKEAAEGAFSSFSGDEKGKKGVLDSGQRPEGTTAAGPLARFALLGQNRKP